MHWIAWNKICKPLEKGVLGFRDLKNFNLALLAKQLWRLVYYLSSLLARVLKGRYYRFTNPLEVNSSSSPSYGWRSILAAQNLLKEGLRRTIGSGYNTRVWFDQWIPVSPSRPAKDNGGEQDQNLYVSSLIDQHTREWREDILHSICDPEDILLIRSIRPSRFCKADGYCWSHTKSGLYSVKSGYDLAMSLKEKSRDNEILEPNINPLKSKVWRLQSPRKIKHFLWRSLSGCLATCSKLVDRHCGTDRSCPRCGAEEKSINHLLFTCPPALQTWALSDIPSSPGVFPSDSLYENFDFLLFRAKKMGVLEKNISGFPWVLWYIWKARNEKVFNGKHIIPGDTLNLAVQEAQTWAVAQATFDSGSGKENNLPQPQLRIDRFDLPRPRCQVDASWAINQSHFGGGLVLELESGLCFFGSFGDTQVLSPLQAEFKALLWAMRNSLSLGFPKMFFESDCLQLIKLIEADDEWPYLASEWEEFVHLRPMFDIFSISFLPRKFNVYADLLAKEARSRNLNFFHVNSEIPNWLASAVNQIESV